MREKLIELLSESVSKFCKLSVIRGTTKITAITVNADKFADHLIANGVTIPVRCKDCKHYCSFYNECSEPHNHYTEEGFREVYDNDFCSYGERRTDETD